MKIFNKLVMTKENNINLKKNETPNFEQINDIFQNNFKIYQNFIKDYQTNISKLNTETKVNEAGTASEKKFTPNDLLNLINPTTTKISHFIL